MDGAADAQNKIKAAVQRVDAGEDFSPPERQAVLKLFERYECWEPYFRLTKLVLEREPSDRMECYVRLARVQNIYLENVFAAAETAATMVVELRLSYRQFFESIIPEIVEFEDFVAEATILSAVCDHFPERADRVACLERLCMVYEKKTHNETELARTYEKLHEADDRNVKALRYFKLVYTQSNDWEEVVGYLRKLLECVSHRQELFRTAQELAAIYLYQLDMPDDAIGTIETYCNESPLDTSQILFDAYQRMGDWGGCLKVLRECLLNVDDNSQRAVLHLKMAQLQEETSDLDGAYDNYNRAYKLWPRLLEGLEGAINVSIARLDWSNVKLLLEQLHESTEDEHLAGQIMQAAQRVQNGMDHAGGS